VPPTHESRVTQPNRSAGWGRSTEDPTWKCRYRTRLTAFPMPPAPDQLPDRISLNRARTRVPGVPQDVPVPGIFSGRVLRDASSDRSRPTSNARLTPMGGARVGWGWLWRRRVRCGRRRAGLGTVALNWSPGGVAGIRVTTSCGCSASMKCTRVDNFVLSVASSFAGGLLAGLFFKLSSFRSAVVAHGLRG